MGVDIGVGGVDPRVERCGGGGALTKCVRTCQSKGSYFKSSESGRGHFISKNLERLGKGAFTNRNGPERTGTDRNGQEWASITGMDLKIHPKIQVLSVLDQKFWLSNVKYQISSMSRQFQCKKIFSNIFPVLPSYSSILLRLIYTSHL